MFLFASGAQRLRLRDLQEKKSDGVTVKVKSLHVVGTFKSLRRNAGGTDLVLTLDDQQWTEAAKLATTEGFLLKITIEIQPTESFGEQGRWPP